ncbi:hypothetical protein BRPE64_BCDS09180 [Caballeronia insecticola]|uniref:Uncharacterized protein n=1 Tax=Caballeronia insecticola TaxID=758793 RepID=R4WM35_9BURK|nr:hypothetical protein BRPE64_BCDS09180 [Caballeronia insecticola]
MDSVLIASVVGASVLVFYVALLACFWAMRPPREHGGKRGLHR